MDPQKPPAPIAPKPDTDSSAPTPPTDPLADLQKSLTEAAKNLPTEDPPEVAAAAAVTNTPEVAADSPAPPKESETSGWSGTPGEDFAAKGADAAPAKDPLLTFDDDDKAAPAPITPLPVLEDDVAPTASVAGGAVVAPKPKKKWWVKALIIGGVAVVLLGGGSVAAYYNYYVPNQPENILKAALVNSFTDKSITSTAFDGTVGVKGTADDMSFNGTFKGNAAADGRLQLTGSLDAAVTKVTLDVRSVDGKSYYFKVGGLKGLPELLGASKDATVKSYATFIGALNGQWFEVTQSLMNSFGVDAGGFKPTQADLQKLADIYEHHPMLKISQVLPDETIKNSPSYHYKVVIDKAEMKALYTEIKDANIKGLKITQEEVDALNKLFQDVNFSKYPMDIWIIKDTKVVDQIAMSVTAEGTTFSFKMTLFDFNKSFKVEKPAGAKSLLEVLGGALGESLSGAGSPDSAIMQELQNSGISL